MLTLVDLEIVNWPSEMRLVFLSERNLFDSKVDSSHEYMWNSIDILGPIVLNTGSLGLRSSDVFVLGRLPGCLVELGKNDRETSRMVSGDMCGCTSASAWLFFA